MLILCVLQVLNVSKQLSNDDCSKKNCYDRILTLFGKKGPTYVVKSTTCRVKEALHSICYFEVNIIKKNYKKSEILYLFKFLFDKYATRLKNQFFKRTS